MFTHESKVQLAELIDVTQSVADQVTRIENANKQIPKLRKRMDHIQAQLKLVPHPLPRMKDEIWGDLSGARRKFSSQKLSAEAIEKKMIEVHEAFDLKVEKEAEKVRSPEVKKLRATMVSLQQKHQQAVQDTIVPSDLKERLNHISPKLRSIALDQTMWQQLGEYCYQIALLTYHQLVSRTIGSYLNQLSKSEVEQYVNNRSQLQAAFRENIEWAKVYLPASKSKAERLAQLGENLFEDYDQQCVRLYDKFYAESSDENYDEEYAESKKANMTEEQLPLLLLGPIKMPASMRWHVKVEERERGIEYKQVLPRRVQPSEQVRRELEGFTEEFCEANYHKLGRDSSSGKKLIELKDQITANFSYVKDEATRNAIKDSVLNKREGGFVLEATPEFENYMSMPSDKLAEHLDELRAEIPPLEPSPQSAFAALMLRPVAAETQLEQGKSVLVDTDNVMGTGKDEKGEKETNAETQPKFVLDPVAIATPSAVVRSEPAVLSLTEPLVLSAVAVVTPKTKVQKEMRNLQIESNKNMTDDPRARIWLSVLAPRAAAAKASAKGFFSKKQKSNSNSEDVSARKRHRMR